MQTLQNNVGIFLDSLMRVKKQAGKQSRDQAQDGIDLDNGCCPKICFNRHWTMGGDKRCAKAWVSEATPDYCYPNCTDGCVGEHNAGHVSFWLVAQQ
jgi:hypothetical protein